MKNANQEVEIRALVPRNEINVVMRRLGELNAIDLGVVTIHDIYFCPKEASRFEDVEMNTVGSYSLRIRRQTTRDGNERVFLNSKTITNHGDHRAWEEHEIETNNFDEAASLFCSTAFRPFFSLEKQRHQFRIESSTVCVEDIKDLNGIVVEIEKMVRHGTQEQAKASILELMNRIGVEVDYVLDKSITNRLMRARAFSQAIL